MKVDPERLFPYGDNAGPFLLDHSLSENTGSSKSSTVKQLVVMFRLILQGMNVVHAMSPNVSYMIMYVCVQIFMKYGRQRWKLRGRIEINAKQVWDSEEMVFLPLISEFLSVKVSRTKCLKPQK